MLMQGWLIGSSNLKIQISFKTYNTEQRHQWPWSPGKMVSVELVQTRQTKVAQSGLALCNPIGYSPWNSPGQNTGVSSLSLPQGIFPTQGSNPGLLHCRQILYKLSHKGSPRTLEWVAYPFPSGSSQPRSRTGVSCIAGRFFTNWVIRELVQGNH